MTRSAKQSAPSSEIAELKAIVQGLTEQLEKLTKGSRKASEKPEVEVTVTEDAVTALNAEEWDTLRYMIVAKDSEGALELERNSKGSKQYKLVKGAQRRWYMVCRGFAQTIAGGRELSNEQVELGQEVLSEMKAAGFLAKPEAKKGRKSSK